MTKNTSREQDNTTVWTLGQLTDKELVNFAGYFLADRKEEARTEARKEMLERVQAAADAEVEKRAKGVKGWAKKLLRQSFRGFTGAGIEVVTVDGELVTFWF